MSVDMSLAHLILGASPVVQLVMLGLVLASVISWVVIRNKQRMLAQALLAAENFEERFWSGADLSSLVKEIGNRPREAQGMEAIFVAGFTEFARLRQQAGPDSRLVVEGSQRAMRAALSRQTDRLEHHLSLLATVGSTSPYVGLFGTVWGIMNSFRALGEMSHATLSTVAPGIAEALIATAMGLFAAIPAVIAYNRYADKVDRLVSRYGTFMEEFSTILQRQTNG